MSFPDKEEWLQMTTEQKTQAVFNALSVLDAINRKTHPIFSAPVEEQGAVRTIKNSIRLFIRNIVRWEKELETTFTDEDTTDSES